MDRPEPRQSVRLRPDGPPLPERCAVCGGQRFTLRFDARQPTAEAPSSFNCTSFGHRHHQPIWTCEGCGLLLQWPHPAADALLHAYAQVEDPVYVAERENRYHTFRRVLRRLGPPDGRRLLDVGAYCGYFLDVAGQAGFDAEGLELSTWAAAEARGIGLTVHNETLAERAKAHRHYDVVTMWDVVEHLADPQAELEQVHALLEPGGQVWLSTIDSGSRVARWLGPRWPWLMDMHLYYFDRRTLPALLERVGFVDVRIELYTHVVSGRYLLEKIEASFGPLAPVARAVRKLTPRRLRIPVNLGDNMLVSARKPS
jgi:2-polyprenyl-3-methyl-5-hydroxy-6-metoxy-1,4-benzoquinol methylase